MFRQAVLSLTLLAATSTGLADEKAPVAVAKTAVVYVIPVREEINTPTLYILRRGLKVAIDQ